MRSKGPRLYFHPARKSYVIRDGDHYERTGFGADQRAQAEAALGAYIERKYQPAPSPAPLLADVFRAYLSHRPRERHCVSNLGKYWANYFTSDIRAELIRGYILARPAGAARRDLQILGASLRYWHDNIHALPRLPKIETPPAGDPRERWISRSEMARLLWAARGISHLRRFIVIGYYSGSRSGAILRAKWSWVDFDRGIMKRRDHNEPESRTKRKPKFRMTPRLTTHLKRWKKLDENLGIPFIIHWGGKPVKRITQSWNEACKRAKVKDATPHALRHTRVSEWLAAGVSVWEVSRRVGMSVAIVERVYGHLVPGWQEDAA